MLHLCKINIEWVINCQQIALSLWWNLLPCSFLHLHPYQAVTWSFSIHPICWCLKASIIIIVQSLQWSEIILYHLLDWFWSFITGYYLSSQTCGTSWAMVVTHHVSHMVKIVWSLNTWTTHFLRCSSNCYAGSYNFQPEITFGQGWWWVTSQNVSCKHAWRSILDKLLYICLDLCWDYEW